MRKPERPPTWYEVYQAHREDFHSQGGVVGLREYVQRATAQYWSWEDLGVHRPPVGVDPLLAWGHVKFARESTRRELPFHDKRGQPFWISQPHSALEELHRIDLDMGGHLGGYAGELSSAGRDRYMINSIMEEAIASSQIEGAVATRKVAKEMLRTERKPRDHSEQMILNNYRTIRWLREHQDAPLTRETLFEIHHRITEDTLEDSSAVGRFRLPLERILVVDDRDGETLHVPPAAEELEERVEGLCAFANSEESEGGFMHPAIRAIVLHFMLAYNHPFVDGNGRTARALFYWHMLRKGYWLFEFLSISRIIVGAPAQYARAFLVSETDEGDVTYFVMFHLQAIQRARQELHAYLDRQHKRSVELLSLLRAQPHLNHRQRALLTHAVRHADATYTIESHRGSHGVAYETARADLANLARRGLLEEFKVGRTFHYLVPSDLRKRLTEAE